MRFLLPSGLLFLSVATAAPMHYSGRALDTLGGPMEGTHDVVVRLYAAADGGSAWHTESIASVPFQEGYFTVSLDDVDSDSLGAGAWVTVTVGTGAELSPRQPIGSVPNALTAGRLWLGDDATRPAHSCRTILESGSATGSHLYWIDPDGGSIDNAYQAHCDMTTEGGGWTLIHTKVGEAFVPWKATPTSACGQAIAADCASAIPAALQWSEVLWRFADTDAQRVIWRRSADRRLADFLLGGSYNTNHTVDGFTRRHPSAGLSGETAIPQFHYADGNYVSELHQTGSDQWLDLWTSTDVSISYTSVEQASMAGRKCISGYCRSAPVWMLVR